MSAQSLALAERGDLMHTPQTRVSHPRVLLVDDEPAVLSALKRDLNARFDVVTASCPFAALECIDKQDEFAVVVADMRMPGLDGADFLESVMIHSPNSVRVMLSGDNRPESLFAAINRGGVFRFLEKPCDRGQLIDTLNAAVAEHARNDQRTVRTADVFAGMNHELRTPLNHIIGFASMIESGDQPEGDIQIYAQAIRESGDTLLGFVDALVTLAALREGSERLDRRAVSLHSLLDGVRQANRSKAASRSILLSVEAELGAPARVVVDPGLIAFALNLVLDRLLGVVERDTRIDVRFERIGHRRQESGQAGGHQDGRLAGQQDKWALTIRCAGVSHDLLTASDTGTGNLANRAAAALFPMSSAPGMGFAMSMVDAVMDLHGGSVDTAAPIDAGSPASTCITLTMAWEHGQ